MSAAAVLTFALGAVCMLALSIPFCAWIATRANRRIAELERDLDRERGYAAFLSGRERIPAHVLAVARGEDDIEQAQRAPAADFFDTVHASQHPRRIPGCKECE